MRTGFALFALVVLGACADDFEDCSADSDCPSGAHCDAQTRLCFLNVCRPECSAHQQCDERVCVPRYAELTLTAPGNGSTVRPGEVVVRAQLVLAEGREANPPGELAATITGPGGSALEFVLTRSGDAFIGQAPLQSEGEYQLLVRHAEADLSTMTTFRVDGTGPSLQVSIAPGPSRPASNGGTTWADPEPKYQDAYRRDEVALIRVKSADADLEPSSVQLRVRIETGQERSHPVAQVTNECDAAWCGEASVNLWELQMNAFRGEFTATATALDAAGNPAVSQTATSKVTRWKWTYALNDAGAALSPVLTGFGTIIVPFLAGPLRSLHPDGKVQWESFAVSEGRIALGEHSPSGQWLYVAGGTNAFDGVFKVLNATTGAPVTLCGPWDPSGALSNVVVHKLPVSPELGADEVATATFIQTCPEPRTERCFPSKGMFVSVRPGSSVDTCLLTPDVVDLNGYVARTVVAQRNQLFLTDHLPDRTSSFNFKGGAWAHRWTDYTGTSTVAAATSQEVVVFGSTTTGGRIASLSNSGVVDWQVETSRPRGSLLLDFDSQFYATTDTDSMAGSEVLTGRLRNSQSVQSVPGVSNVRSAILGHGDWIYLAREAGVEARSRESLSTVAWTVGGLDEPSGALMLDCTRDAEGEARPGYPGVVYVGTASGKLHSFIVDSRGIDTSAPWPSERHDPRSTGNADTDLTEFACP